MTDRSHLIDRAKRAEIAGDDAAALSALEQLVILHPDDVAGRLWLGSSLLDKGDYEAAFAQLDAARALRPNDPQVLGLWSVAARAIGQVDEAVQVLRKLVAGDPSATTYLLLADALSELGLDAEADGVLEEALQLEPDNEEALYNLAVGRRLRDPLGALALLEKAIRLDEEYAEALREQAFCLMRLERWDDAEGPLARAAQLAPGDAWVPLYKAVLLMRRGELDEAEEVLRVLLGRTESAVVHRILGDLHRVRGEYALAEEEYLTATRVDPPDSASIDGPQDASPERGDTDWVRILEVLASDDMRSEESERRTSTEE